MASARPLVAPHAAYAHSGWGASGGDSTSSGGGGGGVRPDGMHGRLRDWPVAPPSVPSSAPAPGALVAPWPVSESPALAASYSAAATSSAGMKRSREEMAGSASPLAAAAAALTASAVASSPASQRRRYDGAFAASPTPSHIPGAAAVAWGGAHSTHIPPPSAVALAHPTFGMQRPVTSSQPVTASDMYGRELSSSFPPPNASLPFVPRRLDDVWGVVVDVTCGGAVASRPTTRRTVIVLLHPTLTREPRGRPEDAIAHFGRDPDHIHPRITLTVFHRDTDPLWWLPASMGDVLRVSSCDTNHFRGQRALTIPDKLPAKIERYAVATLAAAAAPGAGAGRVTVPPPAIALHRWFCEYLADGVTQAMSRHVPLYQRVPATVVVDLIGVMASAQPYCDVLVRVVGPIEASPRPHSGATTSDAAFTVPVQLLEELPGPAAATAAWGSAATASTLLIRLACVGNLEALLRTVAAVAHGPTLRLRNAHVAAHPATLGAFLFTVSESRGAIALPMAPAHLAAAALTVMLGRPAAGATTAPVAAAAAAGGGGGGEDSHGWEQLFFEGLDGLDAPVAGAPVVAGAGAVVTAAAAPSRTAPADGVRIGRDDSTMVAAVDVPATPLADLVAAMRGSRGGGPPVSAAALQTAPPPRAPGVGRISFPGIFRLVCRAIAIAPHDIGSMVVPRVDAAARYDGAAAAVAALASGGPAAAATLCFALCVVPLGDTPDVAAWVMVAGADADELLLGGAGDVGRDPAAVSRLRRLLTQLLEPDAVLDMLVAAFTPAGGGDSVILRMFATRLRDDGSSHMAALAGAA